MGDCEQLLEHMISESPINCKHNPYYGGLFNGNDCIQLVHNMDFVISKLEEELVIFCNSIFRTSFGFDEYR